jgi:GT2 family glycosyltransferase
VSSSVRAELIVVADTPVSDPEELAARYGARVVRLLDGPFGPATARNRGAAAATGDVLVFVDSDVVVHADALQRLAAVLEADPSISAVFGAYDDTPEDPGFVSQCKNLAHAYIHRRSQTDATTFWAGLGAIRADAFHAMGGFDERFRRPSVEDIDLGYRLTQAQYRIRLDPRAQCTHLKRWTAWSLIKTDVRDRGIPWVQLLHRYASIRSDLNLTWKYRVALLLAYVAVLLFAASILWRPLAAPAVGALIVIAWLDRDYYAFLTEKRGLWDALRWFPLHVIHHLGNGVSFLAGSLLRMVAGWSVARKLGALPSDPWTGLNGAPSRRVDAEEDAPVRSGPGGDLPGVRTERQRADA